MITVGEVMAVGGLLVFANGLLALHLTATVRENYSKGWLKGWDECKATMPDPSYYKPVPATDGIFCHNHPTAGMDILMSDCPACDQWGKS